MRNAIQIDLNNSLKNLYVNTTNMSPLNNAAATNSFNNSYNMRNNLVVTDSLNLFIIDINTSRNVSSNSFRFYDLFVYMPSSYSSSLKLVI